MGFAWKLRERLAAIFGRPTAITLSNRIVIGSMVANATNQADAVLEVFIADDNDGDLLNGTPLMDELIAVCALHSQPHPPAPSSATTSVFGNSCGGESRGFHELFSAGIDLSGSAMRLINNGSSYTVLAGGTYVAPSANGFVSAASGNVTPATGSLPTVSALLNSGSRAGARGTTSMRMAVAP